MRNLVSWPAWFALVLAACGSAAGDPCPAPGDGCVSVRQGDGGTADAVVVRSQEGQACSTAPGDDPLLVCTTAQDLICISTYGRMVTRPEEQVKYDGGVRPVFVCRYPCGTAAECAQPGDVCCPGQIHGKTFGKTAACVPAASCEAVDGGL